MYKRKGLFHVWLKLISQLRNSRQVVDALKIWLHDEVQDIQGQCANTYCREERPLCWRNICFVLFTTGKLGLMIDEILQVQMK